MCASKPIRIVAKVLVYTTLSSQAMAAPDNRVAIHEDFEEIRAIDPTGGWEFRALSVEQQVVELNGNHFLYAIADATTFSLASKAGVNPWAGDKDYRKSGVVSMGLKTAAKTRFIPHERRMMTLSLWNDAGTPDFEADDFGFYCDATDQTIALDGSVQAFNFQIPIEVTGALPAGWVYIQGPQVLDLYPPEHLWDILITDVDRVQFDYFDPSREAYYIELWQLAADDITIVIDRQLRAAPPSDDAADQADDADMIALDLKRDILPIDREVSYQRSGPRQKDGLVRSGLDYVVKAGYSVAEEVEDRIRAHQTYAAKRAGARSTAPVAPDADRDDRGLRLDRDANGAGDTRAVERAGLGRAAGIFPDADEDNSGRGLDRDASGARVTRAVKRAGSAPPAAGATRSATQKVDPYARDLQLAQDLAQLKADISLLLDAADADADVSDTTIRALEKSIGFVQGMEVELKSMRDLSAHTAMESNEDRNRRTTSGEANQVKARSMQAISSPDVTYADTERDFGKTAGEETHPNHRMLDYAYALVKSLEQAWKAEQVKGDASQAMP